MKSEKAVKVKLEHLNYQLQQALLKRDQSTLWEDLTNLQHSVDEIAEKIKLLEWVLEK